METYQLIKDTGPIPIMELAHKMQGAVGKLKSKGLIEIFRQQHTWEYRREWDGRKMSRTRTTNWVKVK